MPAPSRLVGATRQIPFITPDLIFRIDLPARAGHLSPTCYHLTRRTQYNIIEARPCTLCIQNLACLGHGLRNYSSLHENNATTVPRNSSEACTSVFPSEYWQSTFPGSAYHLFETCYYLQNIRCKVNRYDVCKTCLIGHQSFLPSEAPVDTIVPETSNENEVAGHRLRRGKCSSSSTLPVEK